MERDLQDAMASATQIQTHALDMIGKLADVARPEAVFSTPISAGTQTLITTSEVAVGYGTGFASGIGGAESTQPSGAGGGGGGGGFGGARPVAVISVGPEGVRVEPIFDVTKIALAFFTAFGSMVIMLARMRRG